MISTKVLKHLIKNKLQDGIVLYKQQRYQAAVYLSGYALEIALKEKICRTLQFNLGFPENAQELNNYLNQINRNNPFLLNISIKNIRHHRLPDLLIFSGAELRIITSFYDEWRIVNNWNPENRYKKMRITNVKCGEYLNALKTIIKEIM